MVECLPDLPTDCVLADVTSVKRAPLAAMLARHPGPVVGLHPMFGPDTRLLSGRHLIICDAGSPEATAEAKALFSATMVEQLEMGLDDHDRLIAYVLGLSHALNIAFFTALARSGRPMSLAGVDIGGPYVKPCDPADLQQPVDFGLGETFDGLVGGDPVFVEPARLWPRVHQDDIVTVHGEAVRAGEGVASGARRRSSRGAGSIAGGIGVVIETVTDNKNRSAAEGMAASITITRRNSTRLLGIRAAMARKANGSSPSRSRQAQPITLARSAAFGSARPERS